MSNLAGDYVHIKEASSGFIIEVIERLQEIQKRHRHTELAWQQANDFITPLFTEMARRQDAGELE